MVIIIKNFLLETSSTGHLVPLSVEENKEKRKAETWYSQLLQTMIPFFIAGFGMVSAFFFFYLNIKLSDE